MRFFGQAGKKKKKEKTIYRGEFQTGETEEESAEKTGLEKTMFLTPEERYVSEGKVRGRAPQEEGEASDYSDRRIVHGNPIIIDGSDYLLRISETRMEALVTLYRRFSVE